MDSVTLIHFLIARGGKEKRKRRGSAEGDFRWRKGTFVKHLFCRVRRQGGRGDGE